MVEVDIVPAVADREPQGVAATQVDRQPLRRLATGRSAEEFQSDLHEAATSAVKADLALRSVADAEGLEATDEELDAEIERIAQAAGQKPAAVRKQLDRNDQLPAVRSDIRKGKALTWLTEHVEIADEEGKIIDRAELMNPTPDTPVEEA